MIELFGRLRGIRGPKLKKKVDDFVEKMLLKVLS